MLRNCLNGKKILRVDLGLRLEMFMFFLFLVWLAQIVMTRFDSRCQPLPDYYLTCHRFSTMSRVLLEANNGSRSRRLLVFSRGQLATIS